MSIRKRTDEQQIARNLRSSSAPAKTHRTESSVEEITPDERRRALEAMAFDPNDGAPVLEPMVLGSLGSAAIEPVGERFPGEAHALASMLASHAPACPPAVRKLAQAALDVFATEAAGTSAARTALSRCVGAFIMNYLANKHVLSARAYERSSTGPDRGRGAP